MKLFTENIEEEVNDQIVSAFFMILSEKFEKNGIEYEVGSMPDMDMDIDPIFNGKINYTFDLLWTGYFPDIRKLLDKIDSVLKPLNSYEDMIIMNWFIDKNKLEIGLIWANFIKTDLYKSLKTTGKYNL